MPIHFNKYFFFRNRQLKGVSLKLTWCLFHVTFVQFSPGFPLPFQPVTCMAFLISYLDFNEKLRPRDPQLNFEPVDPWRYSSALPVTAASAEQKENATNEQKVSDEQ